jgi:hypothetical protein
MSMLNLFAGCCLVSCLLNVHGAIENRSLSQALIAVGLGGLVAVNLYLGLQ